MFLLEWRNYKMEKNKLNIKVHYSTQDPYELTSFESESIIKIRNLLKYKREPCNLLTTLTIFGFNNSTTEHIHQSSLISDTLNWLNFKNELC